MEGKVLIHHGIKGQKWGVRRYQNADGTLTAEGMARYKTDSNFAEKYDRQRATDAYNDARYAHASAEYNSGLSTKYKNKFDKNINDLSNFKKAEKYQTAAYASRADEEVKLKRAKKLINDYVSKYQNKKLKSLKFDTSGRTSIKNYKEAAKIIEYANKRKYWPLMFGGAIGGAVRSALVAKDGREKNNAYVYENTKKYKDRIQELRES